MKFKIVNERTDTHSVRSPNQQAEGSALAGFHIEQQKLTVWAEIAEAAPVRWRWNRRGNVSVSFMPDVVRLEFRLGSTGWRLVDARLSGHELKKNGEVGMRETHNESGSPSQQPEDQWPAEVKAFIRSYLSTLPAAALPVGTADVVV